MSSILSDSAMNDAILEGVSNALKVELNNRLMAVAEKEIDNIVHGICKRVEVKLQQYYSPEFGGKSIELSWLFKREDSA